MAIAEVLGYHVNNLSGDHNEAYYHFNETTTNPLDNVTRPPGGDDSYVPDYSMPRYFQLVGLGIVIPVGIICNVITIVVFARSTLRKTTTGHYLLTLALADLLVMVSQLLVWMNLTYIWKHSQVPGKPPYIGVNFMHTNELACKFIYFFRYMTGLLSSWVTVAITAERFITVAYPLQVSRISTPNKAKAIIGVITLLSVGLSGFPFYTMGLRRLSFGFTCQVVKQFEDHYHAWTYVTTRIGTLILPAFLVIVFTVLIIYYLMKAKRMRAKQLQGQHRSKGMSQEAQLTTMLLSVAVAFILLRLPYVVTYYLQIHKKDIWPCSEVCKVHSQVYAANAIAQVFHFVNYAINFFLYCLTGTAFRNAFNQVCCPNRRMRKASNSMYGGSKTQVSMMSNGNSMYRRTDLVMSEMQECRL